MTEIPLRRPMRLESLPWILLLALSATVISGMGMLVRGLNFPLLIVVTLSGLLLGRILARIRAPWWLALLLVTGSGFQTVVILVGHLLPRLWAVVKAAIIYLFILWQGVDELPNAESLQTARQDIVRGTSVVLTRLWVWLISLGEKSAFDPLPIQLVWGWALGVAIAWTAYLIWQNHQALVAVIPLGVLLTIALFFTGLDSPILIAFLFLTLTLQASNSWKRRQHRWQTNQTDWATDLALDVALAAGALIFFIVSLSAVLPEISLSELIHKLQFQQRLAETSGQRVNNMAASLGVERRAPRPTPTRLFTIPSGLPRRHLLGSGPELTEQLVMVIKTDDPPPVAPYAQNVGVQPPPTYYWLAATFDRYTRRGWLSSSTTPTDLAANHPQLPPQGPGRAITQTVRLVEPFGNFLFTTGFPRQVDQPSQINFRSNRDWAGTVLKTNTNYTAQSWLPQPTPGELREAGTDYPGRVTQRYLALPDNLPARVRSLALELTATAPTPYDRALALEAYLRQIPYSLDVDTPPRDWDVVDYFLFGLQQGYCDYYATSMAVLARAAGLPARFVIGYAPGPYDYDSNQYIVRESEAHSWTQIYFPDYGWIDFEPTGGRTALDRLGEEAEAIVAGPTLPPDFDVEEAVAAQLTWWETMPLWQVFSLGLASLAVLLMPGLFIVWAGDQRLARLPVEQLIPILEGHLEHTARRLGTPLASGATPLEFQIALVRHLDYLARKRRILQKIIPSSVDSARLVNAFVYLRYGPRPTEMEGKMYLNIWRRLRWRLWGMIVLKRSRRIS